MAQADDADARRMLDTARRVSTPEGIELTLNLAGPVPRALAWAVDLLLRAMVVIAVLMVAGYFGAAGWGVFALVAFVVEWLAPAWFEVLWHGQTPGKRALGIAVVHDDGTPVRWDSALTRNLLRAVDFLPFFYGLGLVSMLANRDFKRLGDLAAGTVVVYAPRRAAARALPVAPPIAPPVALSLEEQRVVLEFAERSASLTAERLEELAALAAPITGAREGTASAARLLGMASHLAGRR
jgi:uncharacterized RDD family membrane protein YckC